MERIRVLLVEPGEKPRLVTVPHTLDELQKLVDDLIQATYPYDDPVALVCADNGKCKGFVANRMLEDDNGEPYDIICGTAAVCGILVPGPGLEPVSPAVESQSLNHSTAREVLELLSFNSSLSGV